MKPTLSRNSCQFIGTRASELLSVMLLNTISYEKCNKLNKQNALQPKTSLRLNNYIIKQYNTSIRHKCMKLKNMYQFHCQQKQCFILFLRFFIMFRVTI